MAHNGKNYRDADLDHLSVEQLEELLRADFSSPDPGNEDVILRILEVMERREKERPTGRLPDPEQAWLEFQTYYNIPEGEGETLYPDGHMAEEPGSPSAFVSKMTDVFRVCGVVAVITLVIFGGMLAGEACGFEAFSSLGLWTDKSTISAPVSLGATYMWK